MMQYYPEVTVSWYHKSPTSFAGNLNGVQRHIRYMVRGEIEIRGDDTSRRFFLEFRQDTKHDFWGDKRYDSATRVTPIDFHGEPADNPVLLVLYTKGLARVFFSNLRSRGKGFETGWHIVPEEQYIVVIREVAITGIKHKQQMELFHVGLGGDWPVTHRTMSYRLMTPSRFLELYGKGVDEFLALNTKERSLAMTNWCLHEL